MFNSWCNITLVKRANISYFILVKIINYFYATVVKITFNVNKAVYCFYFHITNIIKNPYKLMQGLTGKKQKRKRCKYTNYFPFILIPF